MNPKSEGEGRLSAITLMVVNLQEDPIPPRSTSSSVPLHFLGTEPDQPTGKRGIYRRFRRNARKRRSTAITTRVSA